MGCTKILEIDIMDRRTSAERNVINKELKYLIKGEHIFEADPERITCNRIRLKFNLTRLGEVLGESEDKIDAEIRQHIKTWFGEIEPKIDNLDFITHETYFRLLLDYLVYSLGLAPRSKIMFKSESIETDDTAIVKVRAKAKVYHSP